MVQLIDPISEVIEWHEFHKRSRSAFFSGLFLGGTGIRKSDFPFDNRVKQFGSFHDHVAISLEEELALREKAVKHLSKDPNYLLRLMEQAYQEHANAIVGWERGDSENVTILSNDELASRFQSYIDDLLSFGIYVTLPLFVEDYLESFLREEFTRRFKGKADYWFGIAVDPVKGGTVLDEEIARLRMISEERTNDENLRRHAGKFGWMANTGFTEKYYGIDHYRNLVEQTESDAEAKLNTVLEARKAHADSFNDLLVLVADDSYLTAVVKTANEAVFFRSYRTEMFYSSATYNQSLFKETSARFGLEDKKDLVWLYGDEVVATLSAGNPADREVVQKRKSGYVFLSGIDGEYHSWEGEDSNEAYLAYAGREESQAVVSEVKGRGAFPGRVTGRVVVLQNASEANKVRGGEVLVTHATNVDFVPVLQKVIAIVTEEGGILSHAAIISRELRIPCVIGTKIATQVFKDGDRVEVDANEGLVRILIA